MAKGVQESPRIEWPARFWEGVFNAEKPMKPEECLSFSVIYLIKCGLTTNLV